MYFEYFNIIVFIIIIINSSSSSLVVVMPLYLYQTDWGWGSVEKYSQMDYHFISNFLL